MQRNPEWKATAVADLIAIIDYISDENPVAAQKLKDEIHLKVSRLPRHPKNCRPGRVEDTREMVIGHNYIVIYSENDGVVTILRILHAAQQWPQ